MIRKFSQSASGLKLPFLVCIVLLFTAGVAGGQSTDPTAPAPIRTNSLLGRIAARDLGDARLTDHYYEFNGTPGDLLITIKSTNLNGDIDVFTKGTLRPLLKLTLYAESTTPITKGIYLRRREDLILRVEARSPNDDDGTYQISFGGSFLALAGGPDSNEEEGGSAATTEPGTRRGKRVNSAGATIAEPVTEAVETPAPKPLATPSETTPVVKEKSARVTVSRTPTQSARSRRPTTRRTPAASPKVATTATDTTSAETAEKTTTADTANVAKPRPAGRTNTRRSGTTARPVKTAPEVTPEPEPEIGPRLIIETSDGTLINRSMSTVRRITVENGQVVVVGRDGKINRIQLGSVVRMLIQP